jgi:hypothetical protein
MPRTGGVMRKETTIRLHKDIHAKIIKTSRDLQIPPTVVILRIAEETQKRFARLFNGNSMVRYQRRDEPSNWRVLHLYLTQEEYELKIDMRNLFKLSVSLMIAEGVYQYLKKITSEIVCEKAKINDSYRQMNYKTFTIVDGNIKWSIFWEAPWLKPSLPGNS